METEIYQTIYDIIYASLPIKWTNILIYAGFMNGSSEIKYYVLCDNCEYKSCFELDIEKKELMNILTNLYFVFNKFRSAAAENWNSVTIKIDSSGNFNSDFDYSDITANTDDYIKSWTNKYLKTKE